MSHKEQLTDILSHDEIDDMYDSLYHYGMPKQSGRYPYGSGEDPYQRTGDFISRVEELRRKNFTYADDEGRKWTGDNAIAKSMSMNSTQFRAEIGLAKAQRRQLVVERARSLKEDGLNDSEIGRIMGKNESSIRSLLNDGSQKRMNLAKTTADLIKDRVDEVGMVVIGAGVERELGITKEKLKQAQTILKEQGYEIHGIGVPQINNPGKQTNLQVVCPPGTPHRDAYKYEDLHSLKEYHSKDNGETFNKLQYPKSLDINRVTIRYAEDGGTAKDGVIELRRGVEDISLGGSRYSQVRILVDGDRYLKGMAVYSDDLPDGVDIVFNTNKKNTVSKRDVMKKITSDPDNPFGSLISADGQREYIDADGNKQLSVINKRADEGDWNKWSDKLPSQFLSKQSESLMKRQIEITAADKKAEYDEIMALENPTVKKKMLQSFADDCDAAAVHLKMAALPRQKYQVILPVNSLNENEVYAPNFNNGEQIALVRFPHGGTFEIPILKVNNNNPEGKNMMGKNPMDAVGINSKVAERLSGADFDGDTVMAIPVTSRTKILSTPRLKGLEDFDTKAAYQYDKEVVDEKGVSHYYRNGVEFKVMKNTQTEMGKASNLITDMTIKGATTDEIARAVKHSMVVIDAEKHKLDYKSSAVENDIAALRKKYQGNYDAEGNYHENASTLLSRASSEVSVPKSKGVIKTNLQGKPYYDPSRPEGALLYNRPETSYTVYKNVVDPVTGKKTLDPATGKPVKIDTGKVKIRTEKSTKMAETDDAYTLVSETRATAELLYADYANTMKALANESRKAAATAGRIQLNPSAKIEYKEEVASLKAKTDDAMRNAPREKQAQILANSVVAAKKKDNPDLTNEEIKKIGQQALTKARLQVGAEKSVVDITDKEWKAIQAGAISETNLMDILNNTDSDRVKQLATPKATSTLSDAKRSKLSSMLASGLYSSSEIAQALGVSSSIVNKYITEQKKEG